MLKAAKIMIVEDEIITAMALKQSLEDQGYEVCPLMTSGKDAIEKAESERPDIVLMDINIKGKIDGIDAAREISSRFGMRTIFMTGYDEKDVRERISSIKSAEYLIKPLDMIKLKSKIDALLQDEQNQ